MNSGPYFNTILCQCESLGNPKNHFKGFADISVTHRGHFPNACSGNTLEGRGLSLRSGHFQPCYPRLRDRFNHPELTDSPPDLDPNGVEIATRFLVGFKDYG
jgi:hypothetical protein